MVWEGDTPGGCWIHKHCLVTLGDPWQGPCIGWSCEPMTWSDLGPICLWDHITFIWFILVLTDPGEEFPRCWLMPVVAIRSGYGGGNSCEDWLSKQWRSQSKLLLVCIKLILILSTGRFLWDWQPPYVITLFKLLAVKNKTCTAWCNRNCMNIAVKYNISKSTVWATSLFMFLKRNKRAEAPNMIPWSCSYSHVKLGKTTWSWGKCSYNFCLMSKASPLSVCNIPSD